MAQGNLVDAIWLFENATEEWVFRWITWKKERKRAGLEQ